MKKLFSIFLVCICLFTLASCCVGNNNSKMQIAPANLSKEEKKILELVDDKSNATGIFDYEVNEDIKFIEINILKLGADGKWESAGGSSAPIKGSGRFLISRLKDSTSMKITMQDDTGNTSWTTLNDKPNSLSDNDKKVIKGWSHVWESKPVEIVAEQTIPLGILCETSKNTMRAFGVESFNDVENLKEYDVVHAITVVFSKTIPK